MDAGNHRRGAQVTWSCVAGNDDTNNSTTTTTTAAAAGEVETEEKKERFVQWTIEEEVLPGQQVCNNYGAKSNEVRCFLHSPPPSPSTPSPSIP
jgi:hypothetical protein